MYISKKRWQELEKRVAELEKSSKPYKVNLSVMKDTLREALQASSRPDPQHLNQSEYPSQSGQTERPKAQDNF